MIKKAYRNKYHIKYPTIKYHDRWFLFFSISREYACALCDLKFVTRSQRKRHVRDIHQCIKHHMCHVCGQKFVQKYVLDKHLLIHAGVWQFKCEHCDKSFRTRNNLRSHIGIHTGEKPFKCGMCPRAFTFSSSAALHRRSHKIGDSFKCTICCKEFNIMRYLLLHMRNIHNVTEFNWSHSPRLIYTYICL